MTSEEIKRLYPEAEEEMKKPLHLRDGRKLPPIGAVIVGVQKVPLNNDFSKKEI